MVLGAEAGLRSSGRWLRSCSGDRSGAADRRQLRRTRASPWHRVRFPVDRADLVEGLRSAWSGPTNPAWSVDVNVSPVGQFLVGVLARHGGEAALTGTEVSTIADEDMAVLARIAGAAILDPGGIDRLYRNPHAVESELDALVRAGAVTANGGCYSLQTTLDTLLRSDPIGSVLATRTIRHGGVARSDSFTVLRLDGAILISRTFASNGAPTVRISSVSALQAANSIAALLFSDEELRELQQL